MRDSQRHRSMTNEPQKRYRMQESIDEIMSTRFSIRWQNVSLGIYSVNIVSFGPLQKTSPEQRGELRSGREDVWNG